MNGRARGTAAVLLLLAAGSARLAAAGLEVRAELAPSPLGKDEIATFTLEVSTAGASLPDVEPGFLLDNLDLVRGPMRSMSHSWVNGESSSRLQLVWELQPKGLGRARVYGIRVTAGDEIRPLPDAVVQVVAEPPAGRAAGARGEPSDPFSRFFDEDPLSPFRRRQRPAARPEVQLRGVVEPASAWTGQQVVWRLLLDTQTDISGFQPRTLPDFAGFWARELPRAGEPRPERIEIGGKTFYRVPMLERALFPLRAGRLPLEGASAVVVARVADTDWFGRLAQDEPLTRTSSPIAVEVRPLPPAPPGFAGVVGSLDLRARLETPRVNAGGATNLVLSARSDGNLRGVGVPVLALPEGLRSFPPATETSEKVVGGRLETTVAWRYVILADTPGSYALPAVAIPYFDPAGGTYRQAASEALTLAVAPRPAGALPPPAAAESVAGAPPPAAEAPSPAIGSPRWRAALPALLALLVVAGLALLARRWRHAHPAARQLREALASAHAAPSPRAAAGAIEEAWRRFLESRFGLGRGLAVGQWRPFLAARGVPEGDAADLEALFEELHLLAWAPELADADALRSDLFERSRRLLRRLR